MGILYIVATPIGNLEDITIRAIKTLASVDVLLCEDTRRTGQLLSEFKKRYPEFIPEAAAPKLISYYDEIEFKKLPEVIQLLEEGKNVALVSDAGTPLIADPGYKLVHEALKRGIRVESMPGPSAILAALTSSGLPTHQFTFFGYVPEKQSQRQALFTSLNRKSGTTIFYVAPHKLGHVLVDMKEALGNIELALARELTKVHEEVWRGTVEQASVQFKDPKGEFVLLVNIPQE